MELIAKLKQMEVLSELAKYHRENLTAVAKQASAIDPRGETGILKQICDHQNSLTNTLVDQVQISGVLDHIIKQQMLEALASTSTDPRAPGMQHLQAGQPVSAIDNILALYPVGQAAWLISSTGRRT
jgi:hypothetical protein